MKVLITGGTGLIGEASVAALLKHGHTVRILSRHADHDLREFPDGVEAHNGDVSDRASLEGSMGGCDVILHVAGIGSEDPPEKTFQRINVEGTRNVVAEAERTGVARIVFVSSLGALQGASEYHKSKVQAEQIIATFSRQWLIVRPGNVYGPKDEVISLLLQIIRTMPVVPVIDEGNQTFQPIWHEDLAELLARAVERRELNHTAFDVAGQEVTTMTDVVERLCEITDRFPKLVHVPSALATTTAAVAGFLGVDFPADENLLTMLKEENYIHKAKHNGLSGVFDMTGTPLMEGLRRLADSIPEAVPADGVGPLQHKHFWVEIENSSYQAPALFEHFKVHFSEIMLVDVAAEPGTPTTPLATGVTMTGSLPVRGHFQMRVQQLGERNVIFATLQGHPIAGTLEFRFDQVAEKVRFHILIYSRSAYLLDLVLMQTVGGMIQDLNWQEVIDRVVEESRGDAPGGVQSETRTLTDDEAKSVESWAEEMIQDRRRDEKATELETSR